MRTKRLFFKTLGAVVALAVLLAFLPAGEVMANDCPEPGDFTFDTGTGTITKYKGSEVEVVIPACFNVDGTDYDVTTIGDGTWTGGFYGNTTVTSVVIPDGVTTLAKWAFFNTTNLETITIPSSVTSFGPNVFNYSAWLDNQRAIDPLVIVNNVLVDGVTATGHVSLPDGVTSIAGGAFSHDFGTGTPGITSLTLPASLTSIDGTYTFKRQTALTTINSLGSLIDIPADTFNGCSSLSSVVAWPSTLKSIGTQAFSGAALTTLVLPEGFETLGQLAFKGQGLNGTLTSVTLPSTLISMEEGGVGSFSGQKQLTSLNFNGTMAQWYDLGMTFSTWTDYVTQVVCSDGTVNYLDSSTTLYVCESGICGYPKYEYDTIQDAVDSAVLGDVIAVSKTTGEASVAVTVDDLTFDLSGMADVAGVVVESKSFVFDSGLTGTFIGSADLVFDGMQIVASGDNSITVENINIGLAGSSLQNNRSPFEANNPGNELILVGDNEFDGRGEYASYNIVGGTIREVWWSNRPGVQVQANRNKPNDGLTISGAGSLITRGGSWAAGIGAKSYRYAGDITIESGTIEAYGWDHGAGIGGGQDSGRHDETGAEWRPSSPSPQRITIKGGDVTAVGGSVGAGIGTGGDAYTDSHGGIITISGGTVNAIGGEYGGAGIGTGRSSDGAGFGTGGEIYLTGGTISATGGDGAAGIGGGDRSSKTETVGGNCGIVATSPVVNVTAVGGYEHDGARVDFGPGLDNTTGTCTFVDMKVHNLTQDTWYVTIQAGVDGANDDDVIEVYAGTYENAGGFEVNTPGITIKLSDGAIIENNSPCFVVSADNTTISGPPAGTAVCKPTANSSGIEVDGGLTNIVIESFEIDGADGTHGILFKGAGVTDVIVRDMYIHDMKGGDGLKFENQPAGTVQIKGNLFMGNTGVGVEAPGDLDVTYNAWGHYDGPTAGDGVSGNITSYDPWTHVALSLTDMGTTLVLDEVLVTPHTYDEITYEIKADLRKATAADFKIEFDPALVQVVGVTEGVVFPTPATGANVVNVDNVAGTISFDGYSSSEQDGDGLVLYTVTLQGKAAGTSDLAFYDDAMFGMSPASGPSSNIYASDLEDGAVLVRDHFTVTGTVSMQGRTVRSGIEIILAATTLPGPYGPFDTVSTAPISHNVTLLNVVEDVYDITISHARYLDVTLASDKTVDVNAATTLNPIELKGGDVNNDGQGDGVIGVSDASVIGTMYGNPDNLAPLVLHGDVNFDGVVNIQDLALVGGNFDLSSDVTSLNFAYGGWTP
jgi:hypothetical protein